MEAVKLDNFLKVDKGIPVPLYYQIKQGILQAIQEGAFRRKQNYVKSVVLADRRFVKRWVNWYRKVIFID